MRGPLDTAISAGVAMIVARGLGLLATEEDSGKDGAVVARVRRESLGAEGGDEDCSVGGSVMSDVESDLRSWKVGPAILVACPTVCTVDDVGSVSGATGGKGGHDSMGFSLKSC